MGGLGLFIVTLLFLRVAACPNDPRDIGLLIDGSSSIRTTKFLELMLFVQLFCKTFPEDTLFSNTSREHFDFGYFQNHRNLDAVLQHASQLGGSSHMATAIQKAMEQFTPQKGARSNAKKFLVVVTDRKKAGDPLEYTDVWEAERAGITCFAVGVGPIFLSRIAQQELYTMASHSATEHIFVLREFSDLMDIQLKEKICASHGPVLPQPTLAPQISCASCSDPRVLQKLEQVMQALDQVKSKLDLLAARDGTCGRNSQG